MGDGLVASEYSGAGLLRKMGQGSEAVARFTWEADLPELFNPIYSMRKRHRVRDTRKTDFEYFMAEPRMRRSPSVIPQIWCSYTWTMLEDELPHWLSVTLTKLNESMDCPAREGRLAPETRQAVRGKYCPHCCSARPFIYEVDT
jgi:hypothetical protein